MMDLLRGFGLSAGRRMTGKSIWGPVGLCQSKGTPRYAHCRVGNFCVPHGCHLIESMSGVGVAVFEVDVVDVVVVSDVTL